MQDIRILLEPDLEFGLGQTSADPHAGLALFGPHDVASTTRPGSMNVGVFGTSEGIERFALFAEALGRPVISSDVTGPRPETKQPYLWPPFPGIEAVFNTPWSTPTLNGELSEEAIAKALQQGDRHQRAFDLSNLYLEQARLASERDDPPRVLVCVIPDDVWLHCRPRSRAPEGAKSASSKILQARRGQDDLFGGYDPEQYELSPDFRRQLKAKAMEFGIPIQLIRESTLRIGEATSRSERQLTTLSDRAWNFATALYYKAGGRPWRLRSAREGVCYVGISFRLADQGSSNRTACCAAQLFLDTGDGVVFRGEFGPWYSDERKQFHLSPGSAEKLLSGVIEVYREQGGPPLREIFLHSRSGIDRDEFAGYQRACPSGTKLVGIRVNRDTHGIRAYRPGRFPVQRGTFWPLTDRAALLWTAGFKPALMTYDGWDTPVPLRIDIQHGESNIEQVAADILGLTKLNYNACRLADALPVTIKFSDMVGEILVSNPTIGHRRPNFKFYI